MSLRCQNWVYEHSEATGNERLILLAIADEADDDGANGHPGIHRLAHKARVNDRTTLRCIERLEEAGRLIVNRPDKKGRGHYNTYVVVMAEGRKGDTLSPDEKVTEDGGKVTEDRAPLPGLSQTHRPIDPEPLKAPKHPPRPQSFPEVFHLTDEMRSWAKEKHPGVDVNHQTKQFAAYHRAKGSTMKNWTAAWRYWMGNAKPSHGASAGSSPPPMKYVVQESLNRTFDTEEDYEAWIKAGRPA